jgi:hypothetical protein
MSRIKLSTLVLLIIIAQTLYILIQESQHNYQLTVKELEHRHELAEQISRDGDYLNKIMIKKDKHIKDREEYLNAQKKLDLEYYRGKDNSKK